MRVARFLARLLVAATAAPLLTARFDPAAGWQFSRLFHVTAGADGVARATWTPPHVGRFRVRATFLGTLMASPSRSGYRAVGV